MIPVVMLLFFKILETSILVMNNSTLFGGLRVASNSTKSNMQNNFWSLPVKHFLVLTFFGATNSKL